MTDNVETKPIEQVRKLKITVSGEAGSGKTTLLKIIKDCLERDFAFRTLFMNAEISMDERVEVIPSRAEMEAKKQETVTENTQVEENTNKSE